ncbi:MAG: FKBP-type peptidyl-prolyl cis-trans isomerase [Clostridia bacterium]|nr:FKBP-type peptidyl-prolyl cis-trans isomerase [Clostridia bacterium]
MKKILVLFLALAVMFTGCSKANKTVLTIGDNEVSQYEFETYFKMMKDVYEKNGGSNIWEVEIEGENAYDKAKDQTVKAISEVKYAIMKVKEEEVTIEKQEELVDSSYENLPEFLKYNKETANVDEKTHEEIVKKVISEGMLVSEYMRKMGESVKVDEPTYEIAKKHVDDKTEEEKQMVEMALERRIDEAKKGELTEVKGRKTAKKGDVANIDYEGILDGIAFEGGTAKGHDLGLGSGTFIPGFEEQIIGKKVGTNFDINVTFPENYGQPTLAGKAVIFKIKLNNLKSYEVNKINEEEIKEEFYKYVYVVDKENEEYKNIMDSYNEALETWKKEVEIVKDEEYFENLKYEKKEVENEENKEEIVEDNAEELKNKEEEETK